MKVLFINQSDFLAPELKTKWQQIVPTSVRQTYLQQLSQKFYELSIPVMHAHKLLTPSDLEKIQLNITHLQKRYNQTKFNSEQLDKTKYFKALYYVLQKAHGRKWLESEFNLDVPRVHSTAITMAQQVAQQLYSELEPEEKQNIVEQLASSNKLPAKINDDLYLDYLTDDQLSHLDLVVRKDEWILCLDETAILQPDFFTKLHNFLQLRLSPEIIDLAEPQLEQELLAFVTANHTRPISLDPQITLKHNLITASDEYVNSSSDKILLSLQQWYEQQLFACLQPKAVIHSTIPILDTQLRKQLKNSENKLKLPKYSFTTQATSATISLDVNTSTINDFSQCDSSDLKLWDTAYYATNEYKRGYHRFNDKIKSYFYVRVYEGSFGSSGFLIRASTIAKLHQNTTTTLSNDLFLNNEFKGFDVAYVRAPWVVGVACPNVLPQFNFKNSLVKCADLWGRKLLCYFKQLRLTASLDTSFKVTK